MIEAEGRSSLHLMIVYTMLSMENTAEICNEDVGPFVGDRN